MKRIRWSLALLLLSVATLDNVQTSLVLAKRLCGRDSTLEEYSYILRYEAVEKRFGQGLTFKIGAR